MHSAPKPKRVRFSSEKTGERRAVVVLFAGKLVAEHPHDGRDHGKRDGEADVGGHDRLRLVHAILVERRARELRSADPCETAENERRTDARENGRSKAVERLGEGQPAVHRLGGAEQADERVGDHLHDDHAAGEDEQGEEEQPVGRRPRCRDEQQAPDHHDHQARRRSPHIADFFLTSCAPGIPITRYAVKKQNWTSIAWV